MPVTLMAMMRNSSSREFSREDPPLLMPTFSAATPTGRPSESVLDAIARILQLDDAERD